MKKFTIVSLILFLCYELAYGQVPQTLTVSTLAGIAGTTGCVDGLGPAARFSGPGDSLAVDSLGNIFIFDCHSVRQITSAGLVSTKVIQSNYLVNVTADGIGNVYLSGVFPSTGSIANVIFKTTATALSAVLSTGLVSGLAAAGPLAGISTTLIPMNTGKAVLGGPTAADRLGNVYTLSGDSISTGTLWQIALDGTVTMRSIAGCPCFAAQSIAVDNTGNVYMALGPTQAGGGQIWMSSPQNTVMLLAGGNQKAGADGIGNQANFGNMLAMTIDTAGNLFVADTDNSTIRKIALVPFGNQFLPQNVSTIANVRGSQIAIDPQSGILYVADSVNHTVLKIGP